MAYLEVRTSGAAPASVHPRTVGHPRDGLDDRERSALMLARIDGKETLRGSCRLRRLSQVCFGLPLRPNTLADPRLEGLRRYAVAVAHDTDPAAQREREQLICLGFSERQILTAARVAIPFRLKPSGGLRDLICRTMTMAKQALAAGALPSSSGGFS
ncbi:hypothetical protein [Sphingomonas oligoaromativorans]|uniref:hypothetical protein n=1 Tax=Sphingomonas oligoaromativorans TaxID=575322 RepID=UPI00141F8D2D|nr:hypothetical protein [Sphingomonas oligoaromativorans]NIJ34121.1 hypothetical protein [Sphingomonas oligoaromativorans]